MRGVAAAGDVVRRQRQRMGWTQEQLATRADCDVKTIRRAEHGGVIDWKSLKGIACALQLSYPKLVSSISGEAASKGLSDKSEAMLRRWIKAFEQRNVDELLLPMQTGTLLTIPGSHSLLFSGEHRGLRTIRSVLTLMLEQWSRLVTFKGLKPLAISSQAAYVPIELNLFDRNGDPLGTSPAFFAMRLRNHKISRMQIYWDTQTLLKTVSSNDDRLGNGS